jgi:hypothetical protein
MRVVFCGDKGAEARDYDERLLRAVRVRQD